MTVDLNVNDSKGSNRDELLKAMTNLDFYPFEIQDQSELANYTSLSLTQLLSFGDAFAPVVESFMNASSQEGGSKSMLKTVISKNLNLKELDGGIWETLLNPAATTDEFASSAGATKSPFKPLSIDPATLVMATLLISIDKKLDAVQEGQQEIYGFLVQKEKSQARGNLNFLSDVLTQYKFNWNNEKYKASNHIKVLDIRQSSEQQIDFYSEQIKTQLKKKSFMLGDKDVAKLIEKVRTEFNNYQLALYLLAFSSLVEVLLLENFDSAYLSSIINRIEDHASSYRALYEASYDRFEDFSKSSLQSSVLKSLAGASRIAGKTIAKVPGMGDSQLDSTLIDRGEKLTDFASRRTDEVIKLLGDSQTNFLQPFIDNIAMINRLHNDPVEIVFDSENIYFTVLDV